MIGIVNRDVHEEVMRPSYVIGRGHLGQRDHVVAKLFYLLSAVVLELDRDDRFKTDCQSTWIHICVTATDDVAAAQPSDAF